MRSSFQSVLAILVALLAETRSFTMSIASAQETDGAEAASNNQPTPTNLSSEAARQYI